MIEYDEVEVIEKKKILKSMTCDICGTKYTPDGMFGVFETQEFHHIHFTGGYGSVFEDECKIECDICQYCLKKMIEGKYREDGILVSNRPEYEQNSNYKG